MATITFDKFVSNHLGKSVDYDGTAGVQCVDLVKCYLKEVFGISPGSWGNAHCYYDNYGSISALKNNFTRIANTASFVPQKGDIAVWGTSLSSSGYGHIAICSGEGTTTYFYSYDQNWSGKACAKIKHTYTAFLGVLRPNDQTNITGPTTTSGSTSSSSTATSTSKSVTAKDAAKSFDKTLTGTYTTTANLNMRTGAGTSKSALVVLPKGTKVQCYGYYTSVSGVKWLYVQGTYNSVKYTGFCCGTYLSK